MKRTLVAAGLLAMSASAFAQTCASPVAVVTGQMTPYNSPAANTCGQADEFSLVCGGGLTAGGASHVYQLEVGAANTFTVSVTPSGGYDTAIFLIGPGACSQAAPCVADADNAGPDAAESLDPTDNLAAGSYYLVVDSTEVGTTNPPACGSYVVGITPELPVELQSFSID